MIRIVFLVLLMMAGASMPVYAQDTLCPDLDTEKGSRPDDVAGVQDDIQRLNLCVERAKLLKQLDDIAQQREETLRKVTDPAMSLSTDMTGLGGIPGMPGASLPPLPTDKTGLVNPAAANSVGAQGNPLGGGGGAVTGVPGAATGGVSAVVQNQSWRVRKIWGQGGSMRAQLVGEGNALLNVVKGDTLPDGKVVESVSIKGVAVSQKGKTTDLSWDNAPDTGKDNGTALNPQ